MAILGLTFKENCPDLRNSKVVDIIAELREYCCDVRVHDPIADPKEVQEEYGFELCDWDDLSQCGAVILAVPHRQYLDIGVADLAALMADDATLVDVKSILDREAIAAAGLNVWRL